MTVMFNDIPGDLRVPLFYAELNSGGTPYKARSRCLMMGQKLSSGRAAANEPVHIRDSQLSQMFGAGSMIAAMGRAARLNAPMAEIWYLPLDDDASGVAATLAIPVSGAPVANPGTLALFINKVRIRIAVKISHSNADAATLLAAEINRTHHLPVTAAAVDDVVTLTARHKGGLGNTISVDLGQMSEEGPLGHDLLTVGAMSGGSGDPYILSALASLGSEEYDWPAMPYSDAANLDAMREFLAARWGPMQQLYGHAVTVRRDNYSGFQTLGSTRNDAHVSIMPANKFRTSVWEEAAAISALFQQHLSHPPELSRPLQTIEMKGVAGPLNRSEVFDIQERNTLYWDGISGYHVRRDGTVCIDRLITTYQTNAWGDPDATYLDVNTIAQITYAVRFLRTEISRVHGRQALADDGPDELRIPRGTATPKRVRTTLLHAYDKLCADGVMENPDAFERALIVERDPNDANRLNIDMRVDHVNQLRIVAMSVTSYMQRSTVTGNLE